MDAITGRITNERNWYGSVLFCFSCHAENNVSNMQCTTCNYQLERRNYLLDLTNNDVILRLLKASVAVNETEAGCSNEEENINDSDIDMEIENTTDFDLMEGSET